MSAESPESKSIERAKQSASVTVRTMIEEGAGLVMPGGKIVAKLGLRLVDHASDAFGERRRAHALKRVYLFLSSVQAGTEVDEVLSEEDLRRLVDEDPTAVLDSILAAARDDEEDEKAEVYGRFYRGLLKSRFPTDERIRFLKAVKALPYASIQFLRETLRVMREDEARRRAAGGASVATQFSRDFGSENPFEVQQLIHFGLFFDKDGTRPPIPHPRGSALAQGLYPGDPVSP